MSVFTILRLSALMVFLILSVGIEQPVGAQDDYKDFKDCLTIKDKAVRYVCYETFAKGKVFSQKKAEVEQKKAFGTGKTTTIDTMKALTVTVVKVTKSPSGGMIFVTSDKQIWKQKGTRRLRFTKVPFEATIKKKLMSGYSLSPVGSNSAATVVRLK